MNEIELDNCCRTCLRDRRLNQMKLLSTKWNDTVSFADMLMDIVNITKELSSAEEFLKICATCEMDLITAYNFKIVCQNTEKILSEGKIPQPIEEIKIEGYKNNVTNPIPTETLHEMDVQTLADNRNAIKTELDIADDVGDIGDSWQDSLDLCEISIKQPKKRGRKRKVKLDEAIECADAGELSNQEIKDDVAHQDNDPDADCPPVKKRKKYTRKTPVIKKEPGQPKEKKKRVRNANNPRTKIASKYCKRCDIKYETNQLYMQHVKEAHWVASPCTFCGKLFYPCHMETHMISHSKEKNHVCSLCGSRFSYEYNLKAHMRIHSGEKRYKCDFCDEHFIHWNSKKNHMYLKHTREKKYECYICHKRFGQNGGMKTHIRYHTGDLPHLCPFCQKRFPSPYKLRRHIRTHRELPAEQLAAHL